MNGRPFRDKGTTDLLTPLIYIIHEKTPTLGVVSCELSIILHVVFITSLVQHFAVNFLISTKYATIICRTGIIVCGVYGSTILQHTHFVIVAVHFVIVTEVRPCLSMRTLWTICLLKRNIGDIAGTFVVSEQIIGIDNIFHCDFPFPPCDHCIVQCLRDCVNNIHYGPF